MAICQKIIDMRTPVRREKRRGFQPPYYTVFIYRCEGCGGEHVVRAGSFRGKHAEPGVGGIICGKTLTEVQS